MKTLIEIFEDWAHEARYYTSQYGGIVYHIHPDENVIYVITKHLGILIGRGGVLFDKYKKIFKDNGYSYSINFVDSFCGIKEL